MWLSVCLAVCVYVYRVCAFGVWFAPYEDVLLDKVDGVDGVWKTEDRMQC